MESPPTQIIDVLDGLNAAGFEAYLVGGCVRDRLLGRPVNDWDVATDAEPAEVMSIFSRTVPTGLRHGTVTVVMGRCQVETTTYRVEGTYTDGRHPDTVAFTRNLHDDLARRDFTINAMAWHPRDDRVIDPFGGRDDLRRRSIRAVGDAVERFREDGLRAMRAIRFACRLGFEIDDLTWRALPETIETFRKVAVERIQQELSKTIGSAHPGRGMNLLRDSRVLREFAPELASLESGPWTRMRLALEGSPAELTVRLAVLLWGVPDRAEEVLRRLRYANAVRARAVHLISLRNEGPGVEWSDARVRRFVATVGPLELDAFLAVARAHALAEASDGEHDGESDACSAAALALEPWDALAARIDELGAVRGPLTTRDLALSGRDVMALLDISPSPQVGRLLTALLHRVWAEPALNTRENLAECARELGRRVR